ncbi:hypothetical protein INT47_006514 [Mucor saturninus]|uniref:Serine/threonine-protein kinase ATR n=1 Tax=Mucor saturninus TaxID=64648 RepID=A0A8H7UT29_9FUNG|nr:hypothetical protein INT47_006514 [Mucor saturninus]
MSQYLSEVSIHPTCSYMRSIQDGDIILEEANSDFLSASSIAEWLQKSPRAKATLTMFDDDTSIELPVYTLRRRNAIVADLPDAPLFYITNSLFFFLPFVTMTARIESGILELFENKDDINDIYQSLSTCLDLDLSPNFCASLFKPLIQHAIGNGHLDEQLETYIAIFIKLYQYNLSKDFLAANDLFNNHVSLIQAILLVFREEHIESSRYQFRLENLADDILLNIIAILTKSSSSILTIDNKEMNTNVNLSIMWNCLSGILICGTIESNDTIRIIIKAATKIIQSFVQKDSIITYNTSVENILDSLVQLLNKDSLTVDISNEIAGSISSIIQKYPNIKLIDPYKLSALTGASATLIQQKEPNPVVLRTILNLSCLILKNYTKAPWLDDVLSMANFDDLEILKEKTNLLIQATSDITFSNHREEDMDIDHSSLQHTSNPKALFDCSTIHETLLLNVYPIVNQLTSSDGTFTGQHELIFKICAYPFIFLLIVLQLKQISIFTDNTEISVICQDHMKSIAKFVACTLVSNPDLADSITLMFGLTRRQFISKYLRYALPYSIFEVENGRVLKAIAKTLDVPPVNLTNEYGYHIVLALLLETDPEVKSANLVKIRKVKNEAVGIWAASKSTKITTILAMDLGKEELQELSKQALIEMKDIIFVPPISLSQYLAQYFVAISTKITRFITEKRSKCLDIHEPHALQALKEIMILMDSRINMHATLLMKLFQTVNELDDMQFEALSLWEVFIETIDNHVLVSNFNRIVYGLLKVLSVSTQIVRLKVAKVLESVFDREIETVNPKLSDLPILPEFEELRELKNDLENRLAQRKQSGPQMLAEIMNRLNDSDDVQVLFELQKLNLLLSDILQEIPIDVGELFSQLLHLVRKHASNKDISNLIALCFGKIGAIDPSLINVRIIDNDVFIMYAFKSQNENRNFICHLLTTYIYDAYNTVKNEYTLQFIQTSIQSLLSCAGFSDEADLRTENSLPKPVQEFLAPYIQSSFQFSIPNVNTHYPLFTEDGSFDEWVKNWYRQMIKEAQGSAKAIFDALTPLVASDFVDITVYMIPYLVLHTILLGSPDENSGILREMLTILEINAQPETDLDRRSKNRQYLQVVVSITEYCRKWLNKIQHGDRLKKSEANRVRTFLGKIPDKTMAIAAYNSKAYPQALMHFETHHKSKRNVSIEPEILPYLKNIYTQMENRVDLNALLKDTSNVLTHDEEMIQSEIAGRWEEAEILHKNRIADNPHDPLLYTGYIDCLKKWGKYETILYSTEKATAALPNYVSQLNSFKIDSAWRVSDWHILDKAVTLPMQKTPEALVGCLISKIRKNQSLEAARCLVEARKFLVEQLTSDFTKSYRKSYPTIYNLQMLQELETSQAVWESSHPIETIDKLGRNWDYNHQNIVCNYQYRHNLLELRKAAYFDIRPKPNVKIQASKAWLKIAKSYRKAGNYLTAYDAIIKAENISGESYYNEKAKWYWAAGQEKKAWDLLMSMSNSNPTKPEDAILLSKFHDRDNTLLEKSKIRKYFAAALKDSEITEKLLHSCTMYYNRLMEGYVDPTTKTRILVYIAKTSARTLQHGSKYYYSSMSMLINSWFELAIFQRRCPEFKNDDHMLTKKRAWEMQINEQLKTINDLMRNITNRVPIIQFSLFLTRLISYLTFDNTEIAECLMKIIGDVFVEYPKSSIWLLLAVENSQETHVAERVKNILDKAQVFNYDVISLNANNVCLIEGIDSNITVMYSLQKPKRITIQGSDGKKYRFLVKTDDDLRKDARTMEFNYAINSFLKKNPKSRDNELYIRTYAVIPLGDKWGLIQWINNISPLKAIVNKQWEQDGCPSIQETSVTLNKYALQLPRELHKLFVDTILPRCPPVFYKWFLKCFPEPNQWLTSRTRYIKTLAVMSIVGYMIGLGDRHAENILFDETNGDCVHVDLNMLFDIGSGLNVPEVVPFRLTQNLVDAMGVLGYAGTFTVTCDITMAVLLQNKDALTSVFQTLGNVWIFKSDDPNRRYSQRIQNEAKFKNAMEKKFKLNPGETPETRVRDLITKASDPHNLSKMFAGWAPFV